MFKVGDSVRVVGASHGYGSISNGDIGVIERLRGCMPSVEVRFPNRMSVWLAEPEDLELVKVLKERRTAKKMVPANRREQVAVRLIKRVTGGVGKFTAVKVESEGNMQRHDVCTSTCTVRATGQPHVGCKRFSDVKVANDFILRQLAKHGLAKRCQPGMNPWGYLYMPRRPLVFSKVYTDSETEWTTTLSLEKASDVLYAPFLVDAFNALIEANGNGVNVEYSGMHTAFIQGEGGRYPSDTDDEQRNIFKNYAKSMRPLLPALYLLGANRMENGAGITRSTSPRQPLISSTDKYSAIAYRYGAVEFRIFDTCYDNRDQLLDNIVVMAQSISKYWRKQYADSGVMTDNPVYFGTSACESHSKNKIESLYVVKDHIVLLNKGLRCIKPPYMTVKEVKQQRNFRLTVRSVKDSLDIESHRASFDKETRANEMNRVLNAAREFYSLVQDLDHRPISDIKKEIAKLHVRADNYAKAHYPSPTIERVAYKVEFGQSFPLGEA